MKKPARYHFNLLLDPRAPVFGFAVFTFSWVWWGAPEWGADKHIFAAGALLVASFLTLFERVWSNFAAAVLGGYLPVQLAYEFWMVPRSAEVAPLSFRHLAAFAVGIFEAGGSLAPFLLLSVLVLACSARTLKRLAAG